MIPLPAKAEARRGEKGREAKAADAEACQGQVEVPLRRSAS